MVSPSEKKVLMRQEAESKLLAQANASRDSEPVRLVKVRSGKGKAHRIFYFQKTLWLDSLPPSAPIRVVAL